MTATPIFAWSSARSLATWPWATVNGSSVNLNNPFHSDFEPTHGLGVQYGVGFPTPFHTSITSLSSGIVLASFYKDFGGVLLVRTSTVRGIATLYYLHMDDIYVKVGDHVAIGQVVGLSGGQVSGGDHPAGRFTTGPHIDVGFNNPNFPSKLGDNFDPTPFLNNLMRNGPGVGDVLSINDNPILSTIGTTIVKTQSAGDTVASGSGPLADNFAVIFGEIDKAMAFRPLIYNQQVASNPVANIPIIGGVVNAIETPANVVGTGTALASGLVDWLGNNTVPLILRGGIMSIGMLLIAAFMFVIANAALGTEERQGNNINQTAADTAKAASMVGL